jgi:PHD/YefM family antitoxin component YafN of YafNO toxin-antitoxin module
MVFTSHLLLGDFMIDLADIRSLSDFQRNTKKHLRRLKTSGKPEVLTVNGQAELVVQSAKAYQEFLRQVDDADSLRILRERIAAADAGENGLSAKKVLATIKKRLSPRESR